MKRSALCLGLLAALSAPWVAWAATQTANWTGSCQTGSTVKSLHGGGFACYTPASGASTSSASPILDLNSCENVDFFLFDDRDGDATACTVTWTIQMCPPDTLANDTARDNACNTLPGTAALTGDDVESNLAPGFLRIVGGGAGANIDSCRIIVHCALDAQSH